MSLLNAQHRHKDLFWNHGNTYLKELLEIPASLNTRGRLIMGEAAQATLERTLESILNIIKNVASKREGLRWLTLMRGSLTKPTLGLFVDGYAYTDLTPRDRQGVLAMMELAVMEYGLRSDYFSQYGCSVQISSQSKTTYFAQLSEVSDEEICTLKDLLDLAVVLYRTEKAYRVAGRGVAVGVFPDGKSVYTYTAAVASAFTFYDERVAEQQLKGRYYVQAGFPASAISDSWTPDRLYAMGTIPPKTYAAYMNSLSQRYGMDYNPHNYAPMFLDMTNVFHSLRNMPHGVAWTTSDLTPEQLIACLISLTRIGVTAFADPHSRYWLGNYGVLPVNRKLFEELFDNFLQEGTTQGERWDTASIRTRFTTSFRFRPRDSSSVFGKSSTLRYMTSSNQLVEIDCHGTLLVDYLRLPTDVSGWLTTLRLDGRGRNDTQRGVLFEEWCRDELERLMSHLSLGSIRRPERVQVYVENRKNPLTNIDVTLPAPPYLFVLSCKDYEMRPDDYSAVTRAVEERWEKVEADLYNWDVLMRRLFSSSRWDQLNPRLASQAQECAYAVPVVILPRVEWVPELNPNTVLHPGWPELPGVDGFPVPRIGTFDDLCRLFKRGCPELSHGADWLIPL